MFQAVWSTTQKLVNEVYQNMNKENVRGFKVCEGEIKVYFLFNKQSNCDFWKAITFRMILTSHLSIRTTKVVYQNQGLGSLQQAINTNIYFKIY